MNRGWQKEQASGRASLQGLKRTAASLSQGEKFTCKRDWNIIDKWRGTHAEKGLQGKLFKLKVAAVGEMN